MPVKGISVTSLPLASVGKQGAVVSLAELLRAFQLQQYMGDLERLGLDLASVCPSRNLHAKK